MSMPPAGRKFSFEPFFTHRGLFRRLDLLLLGLGRLLVESLAPNERTQEEDTHGTDGGNLYG